MKKKKFNSHFYQLMTKGQYISGQSGNTEEISNMSTIQTTREKKGMKTSLKKYDSFRRTKI